MGGVRRRIDELAKVWERIEFAAGVSSMSELTEPTGTPWFRQFRSRFNAASHLACGSGTAALS